MSGLYKIIIHLDGRGVLYNPIEPIHLDSLVYYFAAIRHTPGEPPTRNEYIDPADELGIPIFKTKLNGHDVFRASAIFPNDEEYWYDLRHARKRFRLDRADLCRPQVINKSSHFFKSENIPQHLLLCNSMIAWFYGSRRNVKKGLRDLKNIGAGRRHGYGKVLGFDIEPEEEDKCLQYQGIAMRYYPHSEGNYDIRPRPPYWNNTNTTKCMLPGEKI